MKKVSIVLATLFLLGISSNSFAGSVTGPVTSIAIRASDGLVFVAIGATASGQPTCATHSYWMIKDENSNVGKQQMAAFLAAYVAGKTVTIYGTNTCTRWSDGEDVDMVVVN